VHGLVTSRGTIHHENRLIMTFLTYLSTALWTTPEEDEGAPSSWDCRKIGR
jgi:hypothetical protein